MHKQKSRHKVPESVLRAVLGKMQLTLHATRRTPHSVSRLVQAMSAWLEKTRRAPSRHSRDTKVCGHTTTAMHTLSASPPPRRSPQQLPVLLLCRRKVRRSVGPQLLQVGLRPLDRAPTPPRFSDRGRYRRDEGEGSSYLSNAGDTTPIRRREWQRESVGQKS